MDTEIVLFKHKKGRKTERGRYNTMNGKEEKDEGQHKT